jgi:hypothetical protein
VQNTAANRVDKNNDDFFDSDSSVNTGKAQWLWWFKFSFFLPFGDIFIFLLILLSFYAFFRKQPDTFWQIARISGNHRHNAVQKSKNIVRVMCNSSMTLMIWIILDIILSV